MIAASRYAQCFQNVARYLVRPKPDREDVQRVAWTDTRNLMADGDLDAAAREMALMARANSRIERPVLHMSISWAPEDRPNQGEMRKVAYRVLDSIGCTEHQSVLVAHADEAYAHLHAMTSRIHPETSRTCPNSFFYRTVQATLRRTEREMGFRETPGHLFLLPGQEPPDRTESLSKKALKATRRSQEIPFQLIVRQKTEHHFAHARNWQDLHYRLEREGLHLKPQRRGLVVTDGHEFAKCSSVARDVSLHRLQQRFNAPFSPPERSPLERQVRTLEHELRALPSQPAASQKRQLVRSFQRLNQAATNLPARLGIEACRMLKAWAEHDRQTHELGL